MNRIIKTININKSDNLDSQICSSTVDMFPYLILLYETRENTTSLASIVEIIRRILPKTIVKIIPQYLLTNEFMICLELHCYSELPDTIDYTDGELICGNIVNFGEAQYCCTVSSATGSIKYENCLANISKYLSVHGMSFADVIRQWNYIPDIIGFNEKGVEEYALFNEARAKEYSSADMQFYPAATGIGVSGDEAIIIIYAQVDNHRKSYAVENPMQISAYYYSEDVLNRIENNLICPKPLFSRGTIIVSDVEVENVFISGTASIRGEATIASESLAEQTLKTIENINTLISADNLFSSTKASNINSLYPVFLRVYVRNAEEHSIARDLITQYYPNTNMILLQADICRDNLLVEIEGLV